jgi:FAS-associated factor 2
LLVHEAPPSAAAAAVAADRAKQASIAAAEEEAREAALKEQKDAAAAAQAEAEAQQQLAALLATKQQRLMGEPAASEPGVLKIVVRMPDGSRKGRRFKATDPLQALFDYVDVECADPSGNGDASATTAAAEPRCGFKLGQYRLVTQFPRKVFVEGSTQSLQEAGIASDTALFVEPLT